MARATCIIEGRIGKDPVLKYSKEGTAFCKFGVAVTERLKEGDEWVDGDTTWYNVTAWKRAAEQAYELLGKGDLVLVTGRIKMDTWVGDDGNERHTIAVSADSVALIKASGAGASTDSAPF